ncbi:Eco57I restriction-modification methylase domain-containing protein [Lactobacillus kefiranofaciens]|nr:N-6 DNA methylase [Lactobacillus kefiranofaciens]WGO87050.1 N-6 DNA methylase [Lactobacillus kefiranofaciens]
MHHCGSGLLGSLIKVFMKRLDKQEVKRALEDLVDKYVINRTDLIDKKKNYNESEARREYIDPFLEIFGWDIQNKAGKSLSEADVVTEDPLSRNKDEETFIHSRPDYELRRNGIIYYCVEAKKPSVDIHNNEKTSTQILQYGWSANNKLGILTNFETLQIFQTYEKPNPDHPFKPWKSWDYKDYVDHFDELWQILSNELVYERETDKFIDKITPKSATKTQLDSVFLQELDGWRVLVGQDLIDHKPEIYNKQKNFDRLNSDVQTFLNQIIFLRFAEDNQIERPKGRNELEYIFSGDDFSKKLKALDKKYNSGIFEDSNISYLLSKETINIICRDLYYPYSSYNFAIINLAILGKIYEQFLQEELTVNDGKVELVKTRQSSIKSVVSTPIELTHIIAKRALSTKLSNIKSIEDLLELKIADIAVGSGVFLVTVYDLLVDKVMELKGFTKLTSSTEAPLDIKKKIISNVLYGMDIDKHAVQITKFSLGLRLLKGERPERFKNEMPLIPSMDKHIINGNSLVTEEDVADIIATNEKWTSSPNLSNELAIINPSNGFKQKFDIVIGNPPYLSTSEMKQNSEMELEIYNHKFHSAYKQYDKSYLFIEQMLNILKDDGNGTYIVPNKFPMIDSGLKLREILNGHISAFIDFGANQLFRGKDIYVSIIDIVRKSQNKIDYCEVNNTSEANNPKFNSYTYTEIKSPTNSWLLTDDKASLSMFRAMKDYPRISDLTDTHNGIQTSKNDIYLIPLKKVLDDTNERYLRFKNKGKEWIIEKDICRPFFKNIAKKGTYYNQPKMDSWLIFPYTEDGKIYSFQEMEAKFPYALKYFEAFKQVLVPSKRNVNLPSGGQWYVFGRDQGLTGWDKSKLIVGVMANKPSAAIDHKHLLLASGGTAGYIPIFQKNDEYALEYIEAWLNYERVNRMFKMVSTSFRHGYWTHGTNVMKVIPFLTIDKQNKKEVETYKKIVKLTKQINESNGKFQSILVQSVNKLFDELADQKLKL